MNNKKLFTIIAVVLLLAAVGAALYYGLRDEKTPDAALNNPHAGHTMQSDVPTSGDSFINTESDTYKQYAALTGEAYDKAFLADMIIHHQGAVEMANLALERAESQNIKTMANAIIKAQAEEITNMERWQQEWGYVADGGVHMNHGMGETDDSGSMDMSTHMEMMMEPLRNKTGKVFDDEWITQMIAHHQGALDMAAPGEKNAYHQELKDLTVAVVKVQTEEIKQMKGWQSE